MKLLRLFLFSSFRLKTARQWILVSLRITCSSLACFKRACVSSNRRTIFLLALDYFYTFLQAAAIGQLGPLRGAKANLTSVASLFSDNNPDA